MKSVPMAIAAMLIVGSLLASAGNVTVFEGGTPEAVVELTAPECSDVINITLPVECHILKATMNASSLIPDESSPGHPEAVQVFLNDTLLWEFNETDYGALGMQDRFINGTAEWRSGFGQNGGLNSTRIRLPKKAAVHNATMEISCSRPVAIELFANFTGAAAYDYFGGSVSTAGDVNNDGYDDVVVGADNNDAGGTNAGRAYIYFGGASMNSTADVILTGAAAYDKFGLSVSGAGDVNNDGYDDVVVGAYYNDAGGTDAGRAYIYFGGASMDSTADMILTGYAAGDYFGSSVSTAGDVNNDGYVDVVVGAYHKAAGVIGEGGVYLFRSYAGMNETSISMGPISIWTSKGHFNGTNLSRDFGPELNQLVRDSPSSGVDKYGITFVDILIHVSGKSEGNITLRKLDIVYSLETAVPEFTDKLNQYLTAHRAEKDADGNLSVPIKVASGTPGRLELNDLFIKVDEPPKLPVPLPDFELPEDSADPELVDLHRFFKDDYDAVDQLGFRLVSATNKSVVNVELLGDRFISADALEGTSNDNWTGEVEVVVEAADQWNSTRRSNPFRIIVTSVNDPPLITSEPVTSAEAGVPYSCTVAAVDAENDQLRFSLEMAPENMTIDATTGRIDWMPRERGDIPVTVAVSDGLVSTELAFSIFVPNKPPRVTSQPPETALLGVPWYYCITFEDDNLDPVYVTNYLSGDISVINLTGTSAVATMTPSSLGSLMTSLGFSDGMVVVYQNFTITVVQGNRPPVFSSSPVTSATVGLPFTYEINTTDPDNDPLSLRPVGLPAGMTLDNATGKLSWTPSAPGNFTVKLNVTDGRGGFAMQEFTIAVKDRVNARVEFTVPAEGQKVRGKLTVSGKATKGTLAVTGVQLRVDSGDWMDATGNSTWTYTLDTAKLKNGKHTLQVRAYDGIDYSDMVNRTINVDNAKPAGKGFIPGFGALLTILAAATILALRRKLR